MMPRPDSDATPNGTAAAIAPKIPTGSRTGVERRTAKRIQVRGLLCDRGQVIDLSARGMRLLVHRRWPEGAERTITIVDSPHSIPITARCVWCRQESLFTHVVGLAFENLTHEQLEVLRRIAERHDQGEPTCRRAVEPGM